MVRIQFEGEFQWVTIISPSGQDQIEICYDNQKRMFRVRDTYGCYDLDKRLKDLENNNQQKRGEGNHETNKIKKDNKGIASQKESIGEESRESDKTSTETKSGRQEDPQTGCEDYKNSRQQARSGQ